MRQIRLNRFLAQCGIASRRRCDDLIREGKVKINDQIIYELGFCVDRDQDTVLYDNQPVFPQTEQFVMLNKPKAYLVTASDPRGRKTVFDLLSGIEERLFPIGRLDYDTSGLLLLTNSGELAHRLAHPKYHVRKIYHALVDGKPSVTTLNLLSAGIELADGLTAPAKVRILKSRKHSTWLEIKIYEGRKRQIRRMGAAVGHPVIQLQRVAIGSLRLGNLAPARWRHLSSKEVDNLAKRVNYTED